MLEANISGTPIPRGPLPRVITAWALYITVELARKAILALFAFDRGGAGLASIVLIVPLIPATIVGPALGSIGDRYPRTKVLPAAYAAGACILGLLLFTIINNGSTIVIIVFASAFEIVAAIIEPVHSSILPQLSKTPAILVRANSLTSQFVGFGIFIGPVIAGFLIAGGHYDYRLCIFFIALATSAGLTLRLPRQTDPPATEALRTRDMFGGLAPVVRDVPFLVLILAYLIACSIVGSLEILSVSFATAILSGDEGIAGLLLGATGIGAIAGAALFVFNSGQRFSPYVAIGLLSAGIPLCRMAFANTPHLAVLLLALTGLGIAICRTAVASLTQRVTAPSILTRLFALELAALNLGWILGLALSPLLISQFGPAKAYLPVGVICMVTAAVGWPLIRSLDSRRDYRGEPLPAVRRRR